MDCVTTDHQYLNMSVLGPNGSETGRLVPAPLAPPAIFKPAGCNGHCPAGRQVGFPRQPGPARRRPPGYPLPSPPFLSVSALSMAPSSFPHLYLLASFRPRASCNLPPHILFTHTHTKTYTHTLFMLACFPSSCLDCKCTHTSTF